MQVDAFDLRGAAERLREAASRGCADAEIASLYVRGLVDAREAFRQGAAPAWLAPVRNAIAALEKMAQARPGPAEIARLTLHAAAAAAQSERDEMALYLEHATTMELVQRAAGKPGAPLVSAFEAAGDLQLQVHRYAEARRAYRQAADHVGMTPRVLAGLARVAARLNETADACLGYRRLIEGWGARTASPAEISEARTYLRQTACVR